MTTLAFYNSTDHLAHYGVKGMRWGVRRYQNKDGSLTSRGRKRYGDKSTPDRALKKPENKQRTKREEKLYQRYREKGMSDNQAKTAAKRRRRVENVIMASAAVVVVAGVSYGGYKMADAGEFARLSEKGRNLLSGKKAISFRENDSFAKYANPDDVFNKVVRGINPDYGSRGTTNNCRRATLAYEMRRRGYNVRATKTPYGSGQDYIGLKEAAGGKVRPGDRLRVSYESAMYKRGKKGFVDLSMDTIRQRGSESENAIRSAVRGRTSGNDIFTALSKEPKGSRGEVGMNWKAGGGHSIAYEIFDSGPVLFDAQTGRMLKSEKDLDGYTMNSILSAGYTRLDNKNLNHDFLQKWVRNN